MATHSGFTKDIVLDGFEMINTALKGGGTSGMLCCPTEFEASETILVEHLHQTETTSCKAMRFNALQCKCNAMQCSDATHVLCMEYKEKPAVETWPCRSAASWSCPCENRKESGEMKRRLCSHGLLSIVHTRDGDVRQIDDGKMNFNWSVCCLFAFLYTGWLPPCSSLRIRVP